MGTVSAKDSKKQPLTSSSGDLLTSPSPTASSSSAASAAAARPTARGHKRKAEDDASDEFDAQSAGAASGKRTGSGGGSAIPEYKLVRTDNKSRKLDSYLTPLTPASKTGAAAGSGSLDSKHSARSTSDASEPSATSASSASSAPLTPGTTSRRPRLAPTARLSSVENLLTAVKANTHSGLSEIFRGHTFVGCVDDTFALIQHSTKLYIVNVANIRSVVV
jgi:hypothetical protein